MKYDILFYKSRKTSYCEKAVKNKLSKIDFEKNRVISRIAPVNLGETLCESLKLCNCVVIVGAFSKNDSENLVTVLSRALSTSSLTLKNVKKLKGVITDGYIIRYGKQVILALPDNPAEIEYILSDPFLEYLKVVQ
jgi:hypothetical protein